MILQATRYRCFPRRRDAALLVLAAASLIASVGARSASAQAPSASGAQTARIVVGPDMLVSRDGNFPHVELMVAVNPKNPRNLLGAAITNTRPLGGWACRTYASLDGGSMWSASSFPDQIENGGADPQVAFTPQGTALFTDLSFMTDEKGETHADLYVYRSEDGGLTWGKPADLGHSYDHEQIAVDYTFGKYAGRVYLSVLYGYPVYRVGLFRSDDDGRTWTGPVEAARGDGVKTGINGTDVLIFSDETVIVTYVDFNFRPQDREKPYQSHAWFVASNDGGLTFSAPHKIWENEVDPKGPDRRLNTFPAFAVDNQPKDFRDRLYATWTDFRYGKARVLFSYSADRGNTWTEPKLADSSVPSSVTQYQSRVAVNRDGVIGITWFDTRSSEDGKLYDEYFTASNDGGQTLLPPVKVSSEHSLPGGAGNLIVAPSMWRYKGIYRMSLTSAADRWGNGGDYMGLATDSRGVFHPLWADSRSGTFQAHSAQVRVEAKSASAKKASGEEASAEGKPTNAPRRTKTDILNLVDFIFDPAQYDAATNEVTLSVRLKNAGHETIYAPLMVEVKGFGSGEGEEDKEFAPKILNAANGKTGEGAVFDFSAALGSEAGLEPGATSGALTWKLKLSDPHRIPDLHLALTGEVAER